MDNNSYAQLIDDFEKGLLVLEGESLTDYITRMGGVDYDAKANGGIMGYAVGGRTQNLDQYGLQYGEGLNPYAPDVQIDNMPTNRGYTNFDDQEVGIINTDINKYQNIDNQMAKVFNQQDLIDAGAAKDGILGFSLNDKGDALEKFRNNATKMREGPRYTGGGVQSQFNQLLKNEQKNETINKEFIQEQINKGFLQNPSDFKKQGNLNDLDARLTNEEYLSRNNNLTANANNIGRDFTFDTTSPIPEDIDMQYTVGNEFNVAPQNRSMFERGKDLASSGIGKVGKVGMDAFNLIKNNNPIGLLTSGFGKLGDMFEYKGGDVTVDENGNIISAADLNKQNARGGYYTDAARNARNRTKSLAAFRARGSTNSKRYNDLLLQEIKQTKAREAAAKAAVAAAAAKAQQTRDYGNYGESGGSYSGRGDEGATGANFSGDFATDSASYDLKNGGLATMFRQKR